MSLESRLAKLDRVFRRGPGLSETRPGPSTRETILAIDSVIRRLEEHVEHHEEHRGVLEVPDLEKYGGETLSQHIKRVERMCRENDEAREQWCRVHRPDLLGRANNSEIDDNIAALNAEIEQIEAELNAIDNQGGGG